MAKDPACLFYWGDWAGGTATFTRHLKGCYMDLLNAQFNSGPLSLDEVKTVLGSDFGSSWPALQKKFATTTNGLFFNERLQAEKDKRIAFVKSRTNNLHKEPHMASHTGKRMENGNEIVIEDGKRKEGVGRKPPADAIRDQQELDWETWGNLIVADSDQYWQHMNGRKVSRQEMDSFLSVATRNKWEMDSQQEFRVSLRGFDSKNGTNQPQINRRPQRKDLKA